MLLFTKLISLYETLKEQFEVDGLISTKNFHLFKTEWNNEVARRYHAHIAGDESIVIIHCKTLKQLQEHHESMR